ncbi:MAG: TIM44-like domain-containing protein [Nitrospira sp.]|nr:TIM44-like domain-containing protein [Nitrospira sp.]
MNIIRFMLSCVMVAGLGIAALPIAEAQQGSATDYPSFQVATSEVQTTDAETTERKSAPARPREDLGPGGVLLLLAVLIAATLFYFLKIQRPSLPDFSEPIGQGSSGKRELSRHSSEDRQSLSIDSITSADKAAFQQLLTDVYRAWSKADLQELRQFVTPDMLNYFSAALADNTSQDLRHQVEDVVLGRAEIVEVWVAQETRHASAKLWWSARNYYVSLTKQPGDSGYVVKGSEKKSTESTETWTFTQSSEGTWVLSAIQQAR